MSPSIERPKKGTREPDILPRGERDRPGRRVEIGVGGGAGMDVKRSSEGRKRKRNIWIGAGALGLIAVTVWLSQLEPAAQSVDRDIQLFGTVQRGSFVREVRGPGTLVPEQLVFVTAVTGGRGEQVLVQPGQAVTATTVLVVLSNPDVELELLHLGVPRGDVLDLRGPLRAERLRGGLVGDADLLGAGRGARDLHLVGRCAYPWRTVGLRGAVGRSHPAAGGQRGQR